MKYTPLYRTHRNAGAELGALDGWEVPLRYGSTDIRGAAGLADWSWITKFDVLGAALDPPQGVNAWPLGRGHGLVTCEPSHRAAASDWVAGAFVSSTEVTGAYACFLLVGPQGRGVLHKVTSLDVRDRSLLDGGAAQSSIAHAQGIVLRRDIAGLPAFLILVGRDYGESVWHSILHAGEEFRITPAGVEDVRSL